MKANKYTLLLSSLLLAAVSCTREEMIPLSGEDGELRVPVTLCLDVEALADGTPSTKAVMEPDNGTSSDDQIQNFVVLQFNGVSSSAQLTGGQVYFDHWPLTSEEKVTLVASDSPNTVVVLANTFDRISITSGTTLGTFLQQDYTTISSLSGVFTTYSGNDYLRMSGSAKLDNVTAGSSVNVSLKRNVAKIIVNVTNNTSGNSGDDVITLSKVHLREINAKYYYLAHIASEITAADPSLAFSDPYSSANPHRFDNIQEDFAAAGNSGTMQTYTYYVPANLRGTTSNTYQYNKGNGAPEGATRFRLYGTYGASATPIIYTYYLGGNLTNDFNLLPNYKYTYNITINSRGDANYDYRIDDMGETVFSTDANCYMVHPPETSGQSRIYAIPVRRAAVFWNEEGVNGGVYGASAMTGYTSYVWDSGTAWTAEVLWSDFNLSAYTGDDAFLQVSSGTGFDPANPSHAQPYFKVKVKSGMKGNVVVGVKVNGIVQWSWHFWITEYDPDKHIVPEPGKYIYGVREGDVHRYNNTLWNTTAAENTVGYANGFIMDRNLGAIGTTVNTKGSRGLHYQWGRKDPFVYSNTSGTDNSFFLGGVTTASVLTSGANDPEKRALVNNNATYLSADSYKNIRYTVTHPTVYIYGQSSNWNWTVNEDDLGDGGSTSYRWNDRKFWQHTGDQASLELKKSIYDPCPPGWKVPINGTWNGFNILTAENEAAGTYTTVWADAGRYYYPEGYVNRETTGAIYFPASGFRYYSGGGLNLVGSSGYFWSASPGSATNGYSLYFYSTYVYPSNNYVRAYGFPVRCVRE